MDKNAIKTAFIFPGFGSQWKGMGAGLLSDAIFRETIRECDKEWHRYVNWSIEEEIRKPAAISKMEDTLIGFPCIMAIEIALVELLKNKGIMPDGVIGHSGGEMAAAYTAGILNLAGTFKVIRNICLEMEAGTKTGNYIMAHISLAVQDVEKAIQARKEEHRIFIAAVNSPKATIISGEGEAIRHLVDTFLKRNIFCRFIEALGPFHCPIIEPRRNIIWEGIKDIKPGHAVLPIYSSLLGGLANEKNFDAYFWTDMMIKPVQFTAGISAMLDDGYTTFVEVSPHTILGRNIQEILETKGKKDCLVAGTLKKEADDKEELLNCLSILKRGQAKKQTEIEIARELDAAVREVLNRDTGDMDSYLGFFDMGFNSLTALKLKDSLAQRLDLSLPTTLIFDYPDMASLKKYLASFFTDHNDNINIKKNNTGQVEMEMNEPVAIISMACRFPGGAHNLEAFWDLLKNGRDTVSDIPGDRWDGNAYYAERLSQGKSITKRGNFISDIDIGGFDAGFFKISPKEAESIDPQHRLLLEVAVEALENAGIPLEDIRDKTVGVFTGMCMDDYKLAHVHAGNLNHIDAYSGTGSMFCSASGRISYFLGTRGPTMVVDTACSSTLTAIHLAVRALRSRECEMALAGGVNLLLAPNMFVYLSQLQTLSGDGTCKTFAGTADGYGRGEGCGVLVLKRLSDALQDNNQILALIKGTAVNHDGASTGFTAPNGIAQQEVIYKALENSGVEAGSVDYVEAHGAGTPLGDPIEIRAIHEVYGKTHTNDNPLWVGTVKTNIGHLEGAAGAAAVIKVVLSLQNEMLPAHLHISQPNPLIEWERMPVKINMALTPWTRSEEPRRAGISGFGFSGTNAHIIIEEAPLPRENEERVVHYPYPLYMLNFSAKNEWALKALGELYKDFLKPSSTGTENLPGICYTSSARRSHYRCRFSALGKDREEIGHKLETFLADPQGKVSKYINLDETKTSRQAVFLFTGQGSQYVGMARELFETNRVFKLELETCDRLFRELGSASIIELLYGASTEDERINEAIHAQPVIFSIEYALAKLWISWGLKPALVTGHSIGEYAAACIAGVFTLEDAVKLVFIRGQLMQSVKEPGQMVGILASEEKIRPLLDKDVSIAAVNAPDNITISGQREAVAKVVAKIKQQKIFIEPLVISHAFHSVMMEPYVEKFTDKIAGLVFSTPELPVISTITAKQVENEMCDPAYWSRHICRTVRFYDSLRLAWKQGYRTYLEIGGTATLAGLAGQCFNDEKSFFLPSLRKGKHACEQILNSLSQLYLQGVAIDWEEFYQQMGMDLKKVLLPNYPFQRERYWRNLITTPDANAVCPPSLQTTQMPQMTQITQPQQPETIKAVEMPGPQTMTSIYPALKEMIQTVSGLAPGDIADDADLISLGLDSLMLVELRRKINSQYRVDITLNEFFMTLNTLTKIAGQIKSKSKFLPLLPVFPASPASPPAFVPVPNYVPNYAGSPVGTSPTPVITAPKPLNFSARPNISQRGLSEQQRRHLDALIQRYTARTKTSKQQAQAYRHVLADSKATVGFNPSIKEMLYPLVGKRSQGSWIWDIDGNEYIDVTMGFGVYLFGHHPAFLKNVFQALSPDDIELGPRSYLVGEVAEMIARFTGMERVTFTNSGTEAVMAAIRIARAATGRTKIVMFSRSYHGHSDGTLAVSSSRDGKLISEPVSAGIPRSAAEEVIVLDYLEPQSLEIIRELCPYLAAVLVEPVQSRYPAVQPGEFLKQLREITAYSGTVLIFDEMITGFRIHPGGAQAYFNVQADICTYGKIVGGGLPIGVIAGKARYLDHIDGGPWNYGDTSYPQVERTFFGGTFCQYHEAMAAALAVLKYLEQQGPKLQEQLNQRTETFAGTLNNYFDSHNINMRVSYFGSLFRFDIPGGLDLFYYHMLEKGVYIWEWRNCFLSTAHTAADLEHIIAAVKETVDELHAGGFAIKNESPAKVQANNYFPMSSAQKRIYALSQTEEGDRAYHTPYAMRVEGALNIEKVEHIFKKLIQRHEIFRTGLEIVEGEPVQRVYPFEEIQFSIVYKKNSDAGTNNEAFINEILHPFDLSKPPLLRVSITEVNPNLFIFIMNFHHSVMDGASLSILVQEFIHLYQGHELPPLKTQYKEYTHWEEQYRQSPDFQNHGQYWFNHLSGELPVLELPTDFPRPEALDFVGKTLKFKIKNEKTTKIKKLARAAHVSLNMLLLGIFNVWLFKLTGQEDIPSAIPAVVKTGDFHDTIGMFTNTLVLRNHPNAEKTFRQFLEEVKTCSLQAYMRQEYPYEALVEKLGNPAGTGHNPLFDVIFGYENGNERMFKLPGLAFSTIHLGPGATPFDLFWSIIEEENCFNIMISYRTQLFKEQTVNRWKLYYEKLLDEILSKPDQYLHALDILSQEEKQMVLVEFNNTASEYPRDKTIAQLFAEQAAQRPDRIAIFGHGQTRTNTDNNITYFELKKQSDRLAGLLIEKGVLPDTIVGIMMGRSVEMITGIMGILKAGGAYLPIDPEYPQERIDYMLKDSQTKILIINKSEIRISKSESPRRGHPIKNINNQNLNDQNKNQHSGAVSVLNFENLNSLKGCPRRGLQHSAFRIQHSNHLCYVIYTSGSTGKPKGTLTTHANVIRVVKNTNYIELTVHDRVLQLSNYAFDGSVFDIYGALLNSATLILIDREKISAVNRLAAYILREQVTVFFVTTALFNTLADFEINSLKDIRKVLFGGERVSPEHARKALATLGKDKIIHVYGPTETTVYANYYFVDHIHEDAVTIPIGKPIANTYIYILDKYFNLVPVGTPGELHIGGEGVARGYLNNPELTNDRFIFTRVAFEKAPLDPPKLLIIHHSPLYKTGDLARWLPGGDIEFLGRIDRQVKIRGFRVEIEEIESRIMKCRGVKEVVVTVKENAEDKYLAAYVVVPDQTVDKLYAELNEFLPAFMIPAFIIPLERIPLTSNGKVDRKALPEPGAAISPSGERPRDEIEKKLAVLWAELLGVELSTLGIDSNFFKIGGHSLKAVRLTARIHKEFNVTVTVTDIFKNLSIRNLAQQIRTQVKGRFNPIEPVEKKEYYPVSAMQKRLYLIAQMEGVDIAYNLMQVFIIEGEVDCERFEKTFQELICRHESLRTSFMMVNDQAVQRVHDRVITKVFAELFSKSDPPEAIIKNFLQPFDLSCAPLLRAQLVELSPGKYLFLYDIHHIISDGTSQGIFMHDFMSYYEGKDLPPLKIQYKDFCYWQNEQKEIDRDAFEKKEKYWIERFSGEIPKLEMYTDYPRPETQSFAGHRISFFIEKEDKQRIMNFMKETGTTLYMFLLAVYNILLARYSGKEDIIVGAPTAGREHVDLENVIGVFINALPMRNQPRGNKTFLGFLNEVKKNTIDAYENQGYPFGELLEKVVEIDDYSRNPIFEVELLVQNMEMPEWQIPGLTWKSYEHSFAAAQVDMALEAWESKEEILFNLFYCTALFKKETMERFAVSFREILAIVMANPGIELKDIILSHDFQLACPDIYLENQTDFEF